MYGYPGAGNHPTTSSFGQGYDSPSAAMALGGVPGLEGLGLEGMGNMGTPLGGGLGAGVGGVLGGGGARADEEERRRRLGAVMDVLKVCFDILMEGVENDTDKTRAGKQRPTQRSGYGEIGTTGGIGVSMGRGYGKWRQHTDIDHCWFCSST
jgi:hypothetical protein